MIQLYDQWMNGGPHTWPKSGWSPPSTSCPIAALCLLSRAILMDHPPINWLPPPKRQGLNADLRMDSLLEWGIRAQTLSPHEPSAFRRWGELIAHATAAALVHALPTHGPSATAVLPKTAAPLSLPSPPAPGPGCCPNLHLALLKCSLDISTSHEGLAVFTGFFPLCHLKRPRKRSFYAIDIWNYVEGLNINCNVYECTTVRAKICREACRFGFGFGFSIRVRILFGIEAHLGLWMVFCLEVRLL